MTGHVHSNAINACRVSFETPPFCKVNRPRRENWLWRQFRCGHVCYPTASEWSDTQQKPSQAPNTAIRSVNIATGVIINSFNYTIFTALYSSSLQTHGGNLAFISAIAVLSLGMFILTVSNRPRAFCIHYERKGLVVMAAIRDRIKIIKKLPLAGHVEGVHQLSFWQPSCFFGGSHTALLSLVSF